MGLCDKMYKWWDLSPILAMLLGVITLIDSCPPAPPPELPFSCGWTAATNRGDHRIINGSEAEPHSIPWQAALVAYWSSGKPFCGATILSPWHVLTTVHCAWSPDKWLVVGEHNINQNATWHEIECANTHPEFNGDFPRENDFVILTLKEPLDLSSPYVKAVCLPEPGLSFDDQTIFTVSGWGVMEEKGTTREGASRMATVWGRGLIFDF